MHELRRSFKRTKSLSEDSGISFQISNPVVTSSGDDLDTTKTNNEYSLRSDSGFRAPLLKLNNQTANNSGSSSSTIAGSSISNNITNNRDTLNYCEVYYLSPSKRKSKENLHYSSSNEQQKSRAAYQKFSNENNFATVQKSHTSNLTQKSSLQDSIASTPWTTNSSVSNKNRNNGSNNNRNTTTTRNNNRNNRGLKCRALEVFNSSNAADNSMNLPSFGYAGLRALPGTSLSNQIDQTLDNFDICSHYSDSVAVITKNQPPGAMQFVKNSSISGNNSSNTGGSRSNNVTFSNCTEEHYLHRHRSPSFSNHTQQHEMNSSNHGSFTRATSSSSNSNRGSLRRSKGRSNQSLCSCDAGDSTEIVPDPNRPLFQYSLDRKKKKHTYTCEQNAQILIRLEREKNLRNNSCGNLATAITVGKSSSRKSLDKQLANEGNMPQNSSCDETSFDYPDLNNSIESDSATDVDIPPPPPPPSGRKLSFKQLQDNFIDSFAAQTTTAPTTSMLTKKQPFQSQLQNSNHQHHHHATTNTVSFNISGSTNNSNNNNNNNNDNNNSNNNTNNNNSSGNNNNNNNSNSSNCFKSTTNTIASNLGCNIGEQMLNDCTSTILNCANVGQLMVASAIASTSSSQSAAQGTTATNAQCNNSNKPDLCQMGNNSGKLNILNTADKRRLGILEQQKHQQHNLHNQQKQHMLLSDNNGNMKRSNAENIPLTPYPFIRDDSYLPCFKSSNSIKNPIGINAEESVFFYHQEPPQYKPNFDNRPSIQNNFGVGTNGKYNTIGPSNCYAKQLANHHQTNDFCDFPHLQSHQTKSGISEAICNGGTNLINGRYFSQSLTNFAFTGTGTDGNHSHGSFDVRNIDANAHQHSHNHNYHDFGATILPYTQFRTPGATRLTNFGNTGNTGISTSTTTVNGGLSCSFDNSLISCSFTTIGSGNSGLKGVSGKDQIHQHSNCSNLKGSSAGLSGDSGSSLMPWKHRQCPSRGSSSSATNSLKFDFAKHWLAVSSLLLLIGAASVAVPLALRVAASAPFEERLQIATQILETVPLIDGHNDLPWNIRKFLHNKLNDFNFDEDLRNVTPWAKSQWSHTDLQRLRSGRVSAQFWAAYVPCEAQHRDAVQLTLEQIDVIKRLTERYSVLTTCTSASDIIEAHKDHKLCSLTGVEGGHSLGGSLAVLRTLYAIGVRYMTLTSTCHTPWADSSYADAPTFNVKHGGLTSFGKVCVH
ncbi:putative uncharacterized protein DDB_G0286901 isoform X1 [Condylostylus longicornis]|uniref:putative uncharacterized protein DDB_G0286901 isoform X1 n=1 Tax=Condylostylus longicornis TaxID=2530218 RepID=UPI00244DDDEB|nr:putative uncharacterized protein DDB_G0286901 isoform X1 [Condylostylus longicornis]